MKKLGDMSAAKRALSHPESRKKLMRVINGEKIKYKKTSYKSDTIEMKGLSVWIEKANDWFGVMWQTTAGYKDIDEDIKRILIKQRRKMAFISLREKLEQFA